MAEFLDKGTIAVTAIVSRDPDKSGNFICSGAADQVEIQAAIIYVDSLGGGEIFIQIGVYTITVAIEIMSDITIKGVF